MTKNYIPLLKQSLHKHRYFVYVFTIFLVSYICSLYFFDQKNTMNQVPLRPDTIIPQGYVLTPVVLANQAAISSLIDDFGVIDLFEGSEQKASSKKIATRVKLIRAPLNPESYAVLVPEIVSTKIMATKGFLWAVVQNNLQASTTEELIKEAQTTIKGPTTTIRIEYQANQNVINSQSEIKNEAAN